MKPGARDDIDCFLHLDTTLEAFGLGDMTERRMIQAYCTARSFARDAMLHRAGDIASHVFFISSGLVRFYYITEDGREFNKSFAREGEFAGAIQYSSRPEPGRFHIQALEPTRTLAISLQGLERLYRHSLAWANLGRLTMEGLAVRKTEREAEFLLDSAETRYRSFLSRDPGLAERLPLYHIASFLGITDVALSRIRKRLK